MFFYALRGNLGLRIMVSVFVIWNVYFLVSVYAGIIWLSLLLMLVAVIATCYGSFVLCQHRDEVVFASPLAREVAFPTNRKNSKAVFYRTVAGTGIPFLMSTFVAASAYGTPKFHEIMGLAYLVFLIGMSGIVGILHHWVREAMVGKSAATD